MGKSRRSRGKRRNPSFRSPGTGRRGRFCEGRLDSPRYAPSQLDIAAEKAERYAERHWTPVLADDEVAGGDCSAVGTSASSSPEQGGGTNPPFHCRHPDAAGQSVETFSFTVREDESLRLDRFLAERCSGAHSREYLKELILDGMVLVDGEPSKPSRMLRPGQSVELRVPPPVDVEVEAEDIPLDVHYEDDDLLVAFKPRGMLTHPLGRFQSGTFVNALLWHCGNGLSGISGCLRPGIVHRLDRVTSGLLVVAKTSRAHHGLQEQFRNRQVDKRYLALVEGRPRDRRGLVDAPIGRHPKERNTFRVDLDGRPSQTSYILRRHYGRFSLVELVLHTGRTHQIRVHMRFIGHPVVGDTAYGAREEPAIPDGIALHAWSLRFRHPLTGKEIACRAPLPADMASLIRSELHEVEPHRPMKRSLSS